MEGLVIDEQEIERTEEPQEKSEGPQSLFYGLWLKSRALFGKKDKKAEEKAAGPGEPAPPSFLEQVSASEEPPEERGWMEEEAPEGDSLKELHARWRKRSGSKLIYAPLSLLKEDGSLQNEQSEITAFLIDVQRRAKVELSCWDEADGENRDAMLMTRVSQDGMSVWLLAFAPREGGEEVQEDMIYSALQRANVNYGLDAKSMDRLVSERLYFKVIRIAQGKPAVDGTDGVLVECVPRESKVEVSQNPDGSVDYRSLGTIRKINKGDVICRVEPPTDMICGVDVHGAQVRGRSGLPANLPKIANTEKSEDGCALLSSIDGRIYFENGRFVVDRLLVVDGNVDMSVGNLDFSGDILITGDVQEGFEIKASGNITIQGMVQNANLCSGGSIIIGKGMNGDTIGSLEARGEIHSKFLENCKVVANGDIHADCIIWSDVCCNGSVKVITDKGAIVGGSVAVVHNIEAKSVGNVSQRPTKITLGSTPQILEEKERLEKALELVQAELRSVQMDIRYLEGRGDMRTDAQEKQLSDRKLKKPLLQLEERQDAQRLDEIYGIISSATDSRLRCEVLYPQTRITMGAATMLVEHVHYNCNVFLGEKGIVVGKI